MRFDLPSVLRLPALFVAAVVAACGADAVIAEPAAVGGGGGTGGGGAGGTGGRSGEAGSGTGGVAEQGGGGGTTNGGGEAGGSGEAGVAGAGGSGGGPFDPATATCPVGLLGPEMVLLRTPEGWPYCMDKHEVRQKDYAPFVEAYKKDPAEMQKLACAPEVKWTPLRDEYTTVGEVVYGCAPQGTYDPEKHGDYPQTCMDECAAKAYCAFAGKELCGDARGGPLKVDAEGYADASVSRNAWLNACTNGGKTQLPYGESPDTKACAGADATPSSSPAAEPSACWSKSPPFDELRGLGSGVLEYVNACINPNGANCTVFGPSNPSRWDSNVGVKNSGNCAEDALIAGGDKTVGFRCCKPFR